ENERSWDGHADIASNHRQFAGETDRPVAALLADLKQRGLLDSTLVIWGGEFGRLPVAQRPKNTRRMGRDHNPHAFTVWLAGGGARGGVHYGATDEVGLRAAVDRASVHDLHATVLHLLGMDHTKLTYRYNGRRFRLTDRYGNIIPKVIAWRRPLPPAPALSATGGGPPPPASPASLGGALPCPAGVPVRPGGRLASGPGPAAWAGGGGRRQPRLPGPPGRRAAVPGPAGRGVG